MSRALGVKRGAGDRTVSGRGGTSSAKLAAGCCAGAGQPKPTVSSDSSPNFRIKQGIESTDQMHR